MKHQIRFILDSRFKKSDSARIRMKPYIDIMNDARKTSMNSLNNKHQK